VDGEAMIPYTRTATKLLDIQNVSLSFGKHLVLRDVNATITEVTRPDAVPGQVICFLGPSGIGKTQLSKIIAGLQKPSEGRVLLPNGQAYSATGEAVSRSDDRAVRLFDAETSAGKVGMVPQNYPLFDFTTVLGNLRIAGKQSTLSADKVAAKLDNFVRVFGLADYLHMYPDELSGGTKQRVAIARQMMCAGHYLLMDEPFSGLDPIMKAATSEAITTMASLDSLNTIIIVTHDISEGLSVADTVWLMGYEPDPTNKGAFLPGARLVEQHDLAAMGLCWQPDIQSDPAFQAFVAQIKARFKTLK
jgi:ABC-type nitrate/sulfonate/bicarbonate transport system ATPase subunit